MCWERWSGALEYVVENGKMLSCKSDIAWFLNGVLSDNMHSIIPVWCMMFTGSMIQLVFHCMIITVSLIPEHVRKPFLYRLNYLNSWGWTEFRLWLSDRLLLENKSENTVYGQHHQIFTGPLFQRVNHVLMTSTHSRDCSEIWMTCFTCHSILDSVGAPLLAYPCFSKNAVRGYPGFWNQGMLFTSKPHNRDTPKTSSHWNTSDHETHSMNKKKLPTAEKTVKT